MRTKEFSIVALAVLPLFSILSCGQTSQPEEIVTSSISSEVIEDLLSSAFVVEGLACQRKAIGSGIAVEAGILTNAHVVAGTDELHVIDKNGDQYLAKIVAFDPQTDLALLHVDGLNAPALPIALPEKGAYGVALVGGDGQVKAIPANIDRVVDINIADIYGEGEYRRKGMQLGADISPGDSGGAIIDSSGSVVGLVFSRSNNTDGVSYAVSSEEFPLVTRDISLNGANNGDCLRR
tara:strand:- start:195 stop:902 length:708 start_codon:yes stop_codon:yes gene_type:complete